MLSQSNLERVGENWTFITNRTNINGSFSYSGWAQDTVNNTGISETRNIDIDNLAPNIPILLSPADNTYLTTGTAQLRRNVVTDNGVAGVSGYQRQVSMQSDFSSIYMSGKANTGGVNILSLTENGYYRRANAYDTLGNTSARSTGQVFLIDYTSPNIST